jgi:SAM-dependent methyltransferase
MSGTNQELRYGFGKNWAEYVEKNFNNHAVEMSQAHLASFLRLNSLKGLTFLDIGCGSGLHSLAAYRLGADRIISFDYDPESVATTEHVRHDARSPANWVVMHGSVLNRNFMQGLPKTDIVYSWGVLHHTGDMWTAVRNAAIPMKPDGVYYVALYSSDVHVDPPAAYWLKLKRRYNRSGPIGKRIMEWYYVVRFHALPALRAGQNLAEVIRKYGSSRRGMSFWTDVKDWLGGYPMDFASFEETQKFCSQELGLDLVNIKTGEACTEYLFCRPHRHLHWGAILAQRVLTPLQGPFTPQGGASYAAAVPDLEYEADTSVAPRRSELMMYEGTRMLGLGHALHNHIADCGKGRFSHWEKDIIFSATDNSNPNTNGRTYFYCEKF